MKLVKLKNIIIMTLAIATMVVAPIANVGKASAITATNFPPQPVIYDNNGYTSTTVELPFSVGSSASDCQSVTVMIRTDQNGGFGGTYSTSDNGQTGKILRDPAHPDIPYRFVLDLGGQVGGTANKVTVPNGVYNVDIFGMKCQDGGLYTYNFSDALQVFPQACFDPATGETTCAPLYRFYNIQTGEHFYTQSENEKRQLIPNMQYNYEGIIGFVQVKNAVIPAGEVNIQRFYNTVNGTHFYTASQYEADLLSQGKNDYRYEGQKYTAYDSERAATVPVYRFYNFLYGYHFYTTSYDEYLGVSNFMQDQYRYEGIAYYIIANQ